MIQIQLRRDTAANWTAANPLLAEGELGLEKDTSKLKLGDGVTSWNTLPYFLGPRERMVGMTIGDGVNVITTGVKGSIPVPFAGTIIGWEIEETSGVSGSIQIEVDKCAGTQSLPVKPNTTTDKISASAPIDIASAAAAGVGAAGVATWSPTTVAQWDSIQFNVVSVTSLKRVTLYLRIQES